MAGQLLSVGAEKSFSTTVVKVQTPDFTNTPIVNKKTDSNDPNY